MPPLTASFKALQAGLYYVLTDRLLEWMNVPASISDEAATYLKIKEALNNAPIFALMVEE